MRIETIIRYPRQTATLFTHRAQENAPLQGGRVCRLLVVHLREGPFAPDTYEESMSRALALEMQYAAQHGRTDCLEILERHQCGIYQDRRSMCGP